MKKQDTLNQKTLILNYLKSNTITDYMALQLYGCRRLAARINELRNQGHNIITETFYKDNKSSARYRLIK